MAVSPLSSVRRLSRESLLTLDAHDDNTPSSLIRETDLSEAVEDGDANHKMRLGPSENNIDTDPNNIKPTQARELQRYSSGLWLISLYAIAVIISWVFICVLSYRPIAFRSYYNQTGRYSKRQFQANDWAIKIIRTGIALLGAVSIPITSAICARAAVLYCQTPLQPGRERLTARMTLALADKGWTDLKTLLTVFYPNKGRQVRSPLLLLGALLCGVALVVPGLQGAFVNTVHVTVSTTEDLHTSIARAYEPTPFTISAYLDPWYAIQSIMDFTVSTAPSDNQPNLWIDGSNNSAPISFSEFYTLSNQGLRQTFVPPSIFTSASPVGTDTGVLRVPGLRLGSLVLCEEIPANNFPAECGGPRPFETTFPNIQTPAAVSQDNEDGSPGFQFRLCAPGEIGRLPWRNSNERQEISEELFMDYQTPNAEPTVSDPGGLNYTYHCVANSTMGYFELPNRWNNHTASDVFNELPSEGYFESTWDRTYKFYTDVDNGTAPNIGKRVQIPPANNPTLDYELSSPLLTAVLAIFGNGSYYDALSTAQENNTDRSTICKLLRPPFPGLQSDTTAAASDLSRCSINADQIPGYYATKLYDWLLSFSTTMNMNAIFTMATYASAQTLLNSDGYPDSAYQRPIYSSPGFQTERVHIAPAAMIAISLLIVIQLSGLLCLAIYARSQPTWTETLDSFAVSRFGVAMAEHLPSISAVQSKEVPTLDETHGWIGDSGKEGCLRRLVIGGPELPRRHQKYRLVEGDRVLPLREQRKASHPLVDGAALRGYQELRGYQIYWRKFRRHRRSKV